MTGNKPNKINIDENKIRQKFYMIKIIKQFSQEILDHFEKCEENKQSTGLDSISESQGQVGNLK